MIDRLENGRSKDGFMGFLGDRGYSTRRAFGVQILREAAKTLKMGLLVRRDGKGLNIKRVKFHGGGLCYL